MPSDAPLGTWQAPDGSLSVEYAPEILDEIRREAVDAFFSLPHGGAEIGGILIGTRADRLVRILGYQPVPCEHARGPSFLLSENDHARMAKLLEPLAGRPGGTAAAAGKLPPAAAVLQGVKVEPRPDQPEAVGWYHSHTRSDIVLSAADLQICDRYFPQPGQLALVVRPHALQPTRAGFFFRGADGRFQSERSPREFLLEPSRGRPRRPEPRQKAAHRTPPEPRVVPAPAPASVAPVAAAAAAGPEPPPAPQLGLPAAIPVEPPLPSFLAAPLNPLRRPAWRWMTAAIAAALLAVAGFLAAPFWRADRPVSAAPLLSAVDQNGQLQIRWDRAAAPVRRAKAGALEIVDGGSRSVVLLDPDRLRSGSFQYVRQSERIEVRLVLDQPDGQKIQEYTNFLGRLPAAADPQQPREELAREAERLRMDLKNQAVRTRQLERTVEDLRRQLRREQEPAAANEP
jgi:hypothetical protein